MKLITFFEFDDRSHIYLVHHTAGHRGRRIDGSTGSKTISRIIYVATHTITATTTNLHGNMVDVEFLSFRTSDGELYILIRRVVLCLYPCTAIAGANHKAISRIISILHHSFNLGCRTCSIAVNNSIVISSQSPSNRERVSPTQLNSIHCYSGNNHLVTQSSSNCAIELADNCCSNLGIESLNDCSALIANLQSILPVLFVNRKLNTLRSTDRNRACCRVKSQTGKSQFLRSRLTYIYITHVSISRCDREVGRYFDIVSQDTLFLHQLGAEAGCSKSASKVIVGFIHFRTFVKKSCITLVIVAIAFVKILGGSGHVDKCDILLCCQLLHVIAVVHSMIISSYPLSCLVFTINQSVVFVAQVMTTRTSDAASAEVTTTYGRYQNRYCTFLLYCIDKLLQTLLIRCRGYCTTSVALDGSSTGSIANTGIVCLKFQVVYTIVLLIVVGKLDEHIVTSLNIVLGIIP